MNIPSKIIEKRKITGMSAILLPFTDEGEIDWASFRNHLKRTLAAGLIPAVNMDTGYINLIDEKTQLKVLEETKELVGNSSFLAGAYVGGEAGSALRINEYLKACDAIQNAGGTPIVFQSYGLTELNDSDLIQAYQTIGQKCDNFYAFELGTMFAPFGSIYSLETYSELMKISNCLGAKHSSLRRDLEWQRIELRDQQRPDFKVLTGNDLAIDMVMYGSDYLLGLSSFAPDAFALRDKYWAEGDHRFYELNDLLQYLGCFSFRAPTSAYKHSAAQFLKLRNWLPSSAPHPKGIARPNHDVEVLSEMHEKLNELVRG